MTVSAATDETRNKTFQSFLRAVNRYVTELDLIAAQASDLESGIAEMLRAFAEREACTALEVVGIWPTERGPDGGR